MIRSSIDYSKFDIGKGNFELLDKLFDKTKYNKKNIAETTLSFVKRKFGEVLRARKFYNQVKEIKIKLIVCNLNKTMTEIIYIKLRISTEPKNLLCSYNKKPIRI